MKKLGLMTAVCMGISFSACDDGRLYEHHVAIPSAIRPDSMLVNPGDATTSVLYHVLANDLDATLSRPHHEMISTQATNWPNIVRDWINKK